MRTRSRSRSRNNSPQREASPAIVEPLRIELPFLEDQFQEDPPPESPMADTRTMAELLQAPTEGYEDAIVIPEITANNFELKHGTSSSTPTISSDVAELKDMVKALLLDKKNQSPAPTPSTTHTPVKAVEPNCVKQAPVYQAPIPRTQRVSQTDFKSYVKANDAILRNMQSQVAPVSAPTPNLKPSIPYPSRRDNEKRHDQANEQIKKFYEILKEMSFEISFTNALNLNTSPRSYLF
nr:reverse transcriptase domain-containing protein [Tanacetum cinerariifolium]